MATSINQESNLSVEETRYEKELISYICQNTNGVGEISGNYIAENFDSLQEFLNLHHRTSLQIHSLQAQFGFFSRNLTWIQLNIELAKQKI